MNIDFLGFFMVCLLITMVICGAGITVCNPNVLDKSEYRSPSMPSEPESDKECILVLKNNGGIIVNALNGKRFDRISECRIETKCLDMKEGEIVHCIGTLVGRVRT
jgi:hypothetical protein